MSIEPFFFELQCPDCSWTEVCGREGIVRWLLKVRKIRLGREPEIEILEELFQIMAGQFKCPSCSRHGLSVRQVTEDAFAWPEPTLCEGCSKPIPPERLEALPESTLCAACQRKQESGELAETPEYCPKCGSPMEIRPSRSAGITRYVWVCTGNPPCRR